MITENAMTQCQKCDHAGGRRILKIQIEKLDEVNKVLKAENLTLYVNDNGERKGLLKIFPFR